MINERDHELENIYPGRYTCRLSTKPIKASEMIQLNNLLTSSTWDFVNKKISLTFDCSQTTPRRLKYSPEVLAARVKYQLDKASICKNFYQADRNNMLSVVVCCDLISVENVTIRDKIVCGYLSFETYNIAVNVSSVINISKDGKITPDLWYNDYLKKVTEAFSIPKPKISGGTSYSLKLSLEKNRPGSGHETAHVDFNKRLIEANKVIE